MAPIDFIIAKLRRGTDEDLEDAACIAARYHVNAGQVRTAADAALATSHEDTVLFLFERTVDRFCQELNTPAS